MARMPSEPCVVNDVVAMAELPSDNVGWRLPGQLADLLIHPETATHRYERERTVRAQRHEVGAAVQRLADPARQFDLAGVLFGFAHQPCG